jgi:SagB-type dehydrogenase family enzyme
LPAPRYQSDTSVEQALRSRRSIREYGAGALTLSEVSQLLWAAQGITSPSGQRTAPSAGALYPLEVYLLAGEVEGLQPGVYHYAPEEHALELALPGDQRPALAAAALGQASVREAPLVLVIAAVFERTTAKYGERGVRYVHMEVGNLSQNVYLQAVALDLGAVFIGAFQDAQVQSVLGLEGDVQPLGLMPVGRK